MVYLRPHTPLEMNQDSISLNKYISSTGICSRREADQWIEAGRVTINGETALKGNRVRENDEVKLDGKPIGNQAKSVYIKYNKPIGITSTTDQRDKSNLIDHINFKQRIFPIGRLDKNSTGLLLLTNNGDIVNRILRKENAHEKEYIVRVDKPINKEFLDRMSKPIPMLGTETLPCEVEKLGAQIFKITLTQGLNRQIRRMCEYCGYKVMSLKRVRIMHIHLGGLKKGEWKYLSSKELKQLEKELEFEL